MENEAMIWNLVHSKMGNLIEIREHWTIEDVINGNIMLSSDTIMNLKDAIGIEEEHKKVDQNGK